MRLYKMPMSHASPPNTMLSIQFRSSPICLISCHSLLALSYRVLKTTPTRLSVLCPNALDCLEPLDLVISQAPLHINDRAMLDSSTVRPPVEGPDHVEVFQVEPDVARVDVRRHDAPALPVAGAGPAERGLIPLDGPCVPVPHAEDVHELVREDVGQAVEVVSVEESQPGDLDGPPVARVTGEESGGQGREVVPVSNVEDARGALGRVGEGNAQVLSVDRCEHVYGGVLDELHDAVREPCPGEAGMIDAKVDGPTRLEALDDSVLLMETKIPRRGAR